MLVFLINNPKSGTGKSTTAIHLARSLNIAGKLVLLIDSDPQGSLVDWADTKDPPPKQLAGIQHDLL